MSASPGDDERKIAQIRVKRIKKGASHPGFRDALLFLGVLDMARVPKFKATVAV